MQSGGRQAASSPFCASSSAGYDVGIRIPFQNGLSVIDAEVDLQSGGRQAASSPFCASSSAGNDVDIRMLFQNGLSVIVYRC